MNNLSKILGALLGGVFIGGITALLAISTGWDIGVVNSQQWRNFENLAQSNLSAYAKAFLANNGHLPLPNEQARYYFTDTDTNGNVLDSDCQYIIKGTRIDAYWWSISVHDQNFKIFKNPSNQHSFNMTNILRENDGGFQINIAATNKAGNWLPININNDSQNSSFIVSLRLYGLNKQTDNSNKQIKLPFIEQIGCL